MHTGTEAGEYRRRGRSYGAGFMSGALRGRSIPECMLSGAKKAAEIVSIFEPYHV